MEDYETIRKYFTEKEKENILLKEEVDNLKKKLSTLNDDKSSNSIDKNKSNIQEHNSSYIGMYFDHNTSRVVDDFSLKNEMMTSQSLKRMKSNNTRGVKDIQMNIPDDISKLEIPGREIGMQNAQQSQKTIHTLNDGNEEFIKILNSLDLGKLIDDKPSISNNSNNMLFSNKNTIKSIENSILALRNEINTYEKNYENIHNNLQSTLRDPEINSNKKAEYVLEDLMSKIKLKEHELSQIKDLYENELRLKTEIYNQNVTHLNKTHQEEIRKIRIEYENKMDELIKKSEEEKIHLMKKISLLEKSSMIISNKQEVTENNELIEFQKKYLNELRDLQKNFENFRNKTYNEFKNLKKSKQEATEKANFYKEQIEKLKYQNEINKENFLKMQKFYEESKKVIKTNKILSNELELSKAEIIHWKTKMLKLEKELSNRKFHINDIDNRNSFKNSDSNFVYVKNGLEYSEGSELKESLMSASNSKQNIRNFNVFSQPGSTSIISGPKINKISNDGKIANNTSSSLYNTEEALQSRNLEIQRAHQKMKEIEDCLFEMNKEANKVKSKRFQIESHINLETHQSDLDSNSNCIYNINTEKSLRDTLKTARGAETNSLNKLENFDNQNNYLIISDKCKNNNRNLEDNSNNNKKNVLNKNSKLRQSTYSAEIYDDFNYGRNDNNNEIVNQIDSINKKAVKEVLSNSAFIIRDISKSKADINFNTKKSFVTSNISPKPKDDNDKKIINLKANLNKFSLSDSNNFVKVIGNEDDEKQDNQESNIYYEEPQETCDDNIIEFPLQIKIKGKIKKISTLSEKRK